MAMHNPPHPGEFIQATYLEPFNISGRLHLELGIKNAKRCQPGDGIASIGYPGRWGAAPKAG